MANMNPPELPSQSEVRISGTERRIFPLLKNGPGTAEWHVLHSVRVQGSKKRTRNSREIDFLVMIPEHGLICLEVKGDAYDIRDGQWIRKHPTDKEDANKPETMSPDKQAEVAMDALRDVLISAADGSDTGFKQTVRNIPMWYGVIFTQEQWIEGYEWAAGCLFLRPGDALDVNRLSQSIADHVANTAPRRANGRVAERWRSPSRGDVFDFILRVLGRKHTSRPILTTRPELQSIDRRLIIPTQEQYQALDMVEIDGDIRNDRVMFTGGAGTGKTMVALELARRRHAAGKRVAFICHSEILGMWLHQELPEIAAVGAMTQAFIGHADDPTDRWVRYAKEQNMNDNEVLGEHTGNTAIFATDHPDISERTLKIRAEHLLNAAVEIVEAGQKFDYLIVDELHYFNNPDDLQILDMVLKGGLANGKWSMFGDFQFQGWTRWKGDTPYNAGASTSTDHAFNTMHYLERLCSGSQPGGGWANAVPFRINCRNSRNIAASVEKVVRTRDIAVRPTQVEGPPVTYLYWKDDRELETILARTLSSLREADVRPSQVVVLSDTKMNEWHGKSFGGWELWTALAFSGPVSDDHGVVDMYNVYFFGGMESEVVILVVNVTPEALETGMLQDRILRWLYVGMTRARGSLIILAQDGWQSFIENGRIHTLANEAEPLE